MLVRDRTKAGAKVESDTPGDRSPEGPSASDDGTEDLLATWPEGPLASDSGAAGLSTDSAASGAGLSGRSLRRFLKIEEEGIPELTEMVLSGAVKLGTAERVLGWPRARLRGIVAEGPAAVKRAAKDLGKGSKRNASGTGVGRVRAAGLA